ncbi:hypothetical protein HDU83_006852 [Entophlyctis luteolus]|nr:hypothetical protein HDU83_006852 [Entophlyctis luteolus]KAJ3389124.1 hypothetical protein HDU84_009128 [Entophlyctis sp. JEL0112]
MTILVTGATGFVASHVIAQLLAQGINVRATARSLSEGKRSQIQVALSTESGATLELVEADLLAGTDAWLSVVAGCTAVIHVASPYTLKQPKDESELIRPAVQGTRAVLEACAATSTVRRVVLTSSVVAVSSGRVPDYSTVVSDLTTESGMRIITPNTVFGPSEWTDPTKISDAYEKSKTLAERMAWDFWESLPADSRFELCSVLPGYIVGPYLLPFFGSSTELVKSILAPDYPGLPDPCVISVVDVRDVAKVHVRAVLSKSSNISGQRFIASPHPLSLRKACALMREEFEPMGYSTPNWKLPVFLLKLVALFDPNAAAVVSHMGTAVLYDCSLCQTMLGVEWMDVKTTLNDMGHSLISFGVITRKSKYIVKGN